MANDAFSTIKKEASSLADFKWAIFSLNDVLTESVCLGNNGEMLSEDPDEKHLIENLIPKLGMTSLLILFLQSD